MTVARELRPVALLSAFRRGPPFHIRITALRDVSLRRSTFFLRGFVVRNRLAMEWPRDDVVIKDTE